LQKETWNKHTDIYGAELSFNGGYTEHEIPETEFNEPCFGTFFVALIVIGGAYLKRRR